MGITVFSSPPGNPGLVIESVMLEVVVLLWSDFWGSCQVDLDLDKVGMAEPMSKN